MSEDKISKEIESKFGHHLRIRVNGVLIEENKILLVKHKMSADRDFWSTPGGGMQFGSTAQENLVREFLEETGLKIRVEEFALADQILADLSWMTLERLSSMDKKSIHPVFIGIKSLSELVLCKGYFNFENKYLK
jgi:8-oxo-dGTP pyrophosphatase MutT (NUDIX family)